MHTVVARITKCNDYSVTHFTAFEDLNDKNDKGQSVFLTEVKCIIQHLF